jgi:hypothetical protein
MEDICEQKSFPLIPTSINRKKSAAWQQIFFSEVSYMFNACRRFNQRPCGLLEKEDL